MKMIQKGRNVKNHIAFLVLIACFLMITGIPVQAEGPVQAEETVSASLPVSQTFRVTGSTVSDESSIFTYKLTTASAETPMPAGSTQERYQFSLMGDQSMEIGPMIYFHTGIYEYRLELVTGSEKTGYTYDKEVYFITVYVKDTENDGLVTEVIAKNMAGDKVGSLDFKHSYQPLASNPAIMVDPPVKKTVSGNPSGKGVFKFSLTAGKKTNPMPEGSMEGKKVITIQGEGEAEFGVWSYTNAGIYRYTISEENTGEKGYRYDKTIYTITDTLEDKDGQLMVTRIIVNNDKKQVDTCAFRNHYSALGSDTDNGNVRGGFWKGSNYISPVKTGDTSNIVLWIVILVMAATGVFVAVKVRRKKK